MAASLEQADIAIPIPGVGPSNTVVPARRSSVGSLPTSAGPLAAYVRLSLRREMSRPLDLRLRLRNAVLRPSGLMLPARSGGLRPSGSTLLARSVAPPLWGAQSVLTDCGLGAVLVPGGWLRSVVAEYSTPGSPLEASKLAHQPWVRPLLD